VARVPIDGANSNVDHFIPGLAVNKATSGSTAQLALTYYFFPTAKSTSLSVGFISSGNGGSTWSAPTTVTSGMPTMWAANTSQGRMVGDYISTSFGSDNFGHGVFATAGAPTSGTSCAGDACNEPTSTFGGSAAGGSASGAGSAVLFAGLGNVNAQSLWNVVDNNGSKHRD
jgi:hypothetical protein